MKNFILIFTVLMVSVGCASNQTMEKKPVAETELKPQKNDDGEWDLEVFDTDFNYFLSAVAKPINMYSESTLKSRNSFLVREWNGYYYSGRYRNVIESAIDYDINEKYGLKFEYKLYQVFAYVYWKYGLRMSGISGADVMR